MKSKNITILIIVILTLSALGAFFYLSKEKKESKKEVVEKRAENTRKTEEGYYPKVKEVVHKTNGKVISKNGATVFIKIPNPKKNLPNAKKITKLAIVSPKTKITKVDYTKRDEKGRPEREQININSIKKGDSVRVKTNKNIQEEKSFVAEWIRVIKS
ncbi:MAG: hypothetical protein ABEI53_02410 [Candidatus Magasanikbacteria bacterium]